MIMGTAAAPCDLSGVVRVRCNQGSREPSRRAQSHREPPGIVLMAISFRDVVPGQHGWPERGAVEESRFATFDIRRIAAANPLLS